MERVYVFVDYSTGTSIDGLVGDTEAKVLAATDSIKASADRWASQVGVDPIFETTG